MQHSDRSYKKRGSALLSPQLEIANPKEDPPTQLPEIKTNHQPSKSVQKQSSKAEFKVNGKRISSNIHSVSVAKFKKKSLTRIPSRVAGKKDSRVSMIVESKKHNFVPEPKQQEKRTIILTPTEDMDVLVESQSKDS